VNKFRDALYRFMYGRNGVDALNWALVILELVVSILSSIIRMQGVSQALYFVSMVLMFIVLIRIFSRNLAHRQAENAKFLTWWTPKANAIRGAKARRADKSFPMTSPELMRELGAYLLGLHNYLRVDVKNPQFKVIVEIRDYGAYIHGPKIPGEGGLPVGTSGRALNMLSGGIDSPVAAYRMAKRGLALDHIHFASPPYTSERAKLKVKALAQKITPYTGSSNLFVVPYTKPQEYIRDNAPDVLFTVLMRRSMMRIANIIAKKQGCEALITGESLAQVASQTVKALQCTDAAQDLPILRPLIGMDKTEIIETSRHIGTYETSILPYEDCCTIFTPPHPKIRPELAEILEAEAAMPGLAELEAEAAENTERIRIRITDEIEFEG